MEHMSEHGVEPKAWNSIYESTTKIGVEPMTMLRIEPVTKHEFYVGGELFISVDIVENDEFQHGDDQKWIIGDGRVNQIEQIHSSSSYLMEGWMDDWMGSMDDDWMDQ